MQTARATEDRIPAPAPAVAIGRSESAAADAAGMPLVVAVVLNWCGFEVTAACLESLLGTMYARLEILLVDNGSPDGSGPRLRQRFPDVPYLQTGENLGYAGGNNRGIDWALERGADFVLVINNDTVADPEAVSKLVEAADADARAGAVSPKILFHDEPEKIWFGGGRLSRLRAIGHHCREGEMDDRSRPELVEKVTFLSGCCLLVPAAVLRAVGGFDEDLFAYVEDVDLSLRLSAAGYTLLYQPEARILHHTRSAKATPSPFQIVLRDRNRRRVAGRRFNWFRRIVFYLFFYPTRSFHLLSYAVRGDYARARAIWRGMTVA